MRTILQHHLEQELEEKPETYSSNQLLYRQALLSLQVLEIAALAFLDP